MKTDDWDLSNVTKEKEFNTDFTVLGLLGPAGSGKDLVADWFCNQGFVKVAFADPIKRFTSKVFGFDHDHLWGPSEKRNEILKVDEAWWFEAIGHLGEGSVEVISEVLEPGFRTEGYLKLHDWLTSLRKEYRETISARVVLQTLGTEWGRAVDEFMWIKYAHKIARRLREDGSRCSYSQGSGLIVLPSAIVIAPKGVVIPDHRFLNEVNLTHEMGGHVLRLRRLELEKKNETVGIAGHRSEAEQKTLPDNIFHLILEFPEGIEKVHEMLKQTYEAKAWNLWRLKPTIREDHS